MADYTLIQSGDANAAENVGALAGTLPVPRLVSGLALSGYDSAGPTVDIAAGKTAHVLDAATAEWTEDDGTQRSAGRDHVLVVAHLDARTDVALTDGATNHLFVDANWSEDDQPELVVNTTGDPPAASALKVAEVDTAADSISGQWALVAGDGTLTYPDEAAADAASTSLPSGTVVYDRAGGQHFYVTD
ncbi:hypothetical protein J2752_000472 [Halarchaeum rubridurum]|uniref:Uncharacterized protein n=1 Tax=Halarchaeum rubridurum TaxID=489911 RepID=A0A830FYV1_9EURY|nr:hypothetical protein [Halarchaeum rubridurum]MBP1953591.1 hypothetical protein [Halarchaeum rubridurum]GGM64131.1 hypothetical protein GCM10009017_12720 [Halarchaeum rubridurum]